MGFSRRASMQSLVCLCYLSIHLTIGLSISLAARADSTAQQAAGIAQALQALDQNDPDQHWRFTMELVEDGERRVITSDPARARYDRRQLLLVDDQAPDEKTLRKFRKAEKKRIDDIDPDARGFSYLVDLDTLKRQDDDAGLVQFTFTPRIKDFTEVQEHLDGTLLFNSDTGHIDKIEIRNTAELTPAFSVSLETYRLSFYFRDEQGARLLDRMESRAAGKAGFIKRFDSKVDISFRDYRRS